MSTVPEINYATSPSAATTRRQTGPSSSRTESYDQTGFPQRVHRIESEVGVESETSVAIDIFEGVPLVTGRPLSWLGNLTTVLRGRDQKGGEPLTLLWGQRGSGVDCCADPIGEACSSQVTPCIQ